MAGPNNPIHFIQILTSEPHIERDAGHVGSPSAPHNHALLRTDCIGHSTANFTIRSLVRHGSVAGTSHVQRRKRRRILRRRNAQQGKEAGAIVSGRASRDQPQLARWFVRASQNGYSWRQQLRPPQRALEPCEMSICRQIVHHVNCLKA
jgi:hypothetical protein